MLTYLKGELTRILYAHILCTWGMRMKARNRKAVNVSISNDLIIESKAYGINLSRALEEKLIQLLREKREEDWRAENQEAINSYNARIEAQGEFSKKLRRF